MIRRDHERGVALPKDALDLPPHIKMDSIRDWTDYGIWGLLLYDEQPPWFTLIECMHILFDRYLSNSEQLFVTPTIGKGEHERVTYKVPLNLGLRHLLFRDLETATVVANGAPDPSAEWRHFHCVTRESAGDLGLSFKHLDRAFDDLKSLSDSLDLLRSTEVAASSARRWTSRHILPLGPNMLFADVKDQGIRDGKYPADRRFVRRSGEILYLMLGRARPSELCHEVANLLRKRLLDLDTPWNRIASLIRGAGSTTGSAGEKTVELSTGYLPIRVLPVYDRVAQDWEALLSLHRKPIEDLLDPLMRLSTLHQIIYILDRAHTTKTGDSCDNFPPFVFDLAMSARKNPVQRISLRQYSSHQMLPRHAIDAFVDAFEQSEHWKSIPNTEIGLGKAKKILQEMFLWKDSKKENSGDIESPAKILERFRESALKGTKHSIWSTLSYQTKAIGMAMAKPGAGTWYAPNDALLEALVLANVRDPMELGVFLGRLYDRYRIVVGQQQAQTAFGSNAEMSLEQLKVNEQRLEHRLRILGFVDRKSDACAFVVNPYFESGSEATAESV